MNRFEGNSALITGGSRGIGFAIARRLVEEGAVVTIVARTASSLDNAVARLRDLGGEIHGIQGDIADTGFDESLVLNVLDAQGRIDVLVNNAGIFSEAQFTEVTLQDWDMAMAVMLRSPFVLGQLVARSMIERGIGGSIVNVSSLEARAGDGLYGGYAPAKAGLNQLTRNMSVELGPHRIRVNSVSPGLCRTDMTTELLEPEILEKLEGGFERVPLRRLVAPEEVAAAVCFLASEDASGISGEDLLVDGGTAADLFITPSLFDGARPIADGPRAHR